MSNFLNSFNNGFLFGMLSSSPIFGCFRNYWNNFAPFMPSFSLFCNFGWNNYTPMASMQSFSSIGVTNPAYSPSFTPTFGSIDLPPITNNAFSQAMPSNISIWDATNYTQLPSSMQMWDSFTKTQNTNSSDFQLSSNNCSSWQTAPQTNYMQSYAPSPTTALNAKSASYETTSKSLPDQNISYDSNELKAKWSKKKSGLSNTFYNKVISISKRVNCNPNDLMALMYSESKLNPANVNRGSGATGLIQFMPKTAPEIGTTVEALKKMTAEQQLDYVEKYLLYAKKISGQKVNDYIDRGTLYALTFLPAVSKQETLCYSGSKEYNQNRVLDYNKDNKITKTDLSNILTGFLA